MIRLQLFAEEKTEKATPKKRHDVRKKGQVFQSRDIVSSVLLLVLVMALNTFFPFIVKTIETFTVQMITNYLSNYNDLFTTQNIHGFFILILLTVVKIIAPILILVLVIGLLLNYGQVGFIFTGETLGFKLERINPMEGFKRIFSSRGFIELLKSLLKIVLIGYMLYVTIMAQIKLLPQLLDMSINDIANYLRNAIVAIGLKSGMLVLAISVFDYLYQWWDYEKNIKMTKQEVKDEIKETEGNPQIKSKIKERQRKISLRRMMDDISTADVVVTNPTHYAVALKYDSKKNSAPVVVAKGVDYLALRIKEEARKHSVPIVENRELARNLYSMTEIGQMIPAELYNSVAEVLAFVYSINNGKRGIN